ncbi:hypothetical protein BUALT_Bualt11G0055800 [Buddleja alternifolia]|uniref:Retrotransposon gag domain-containing protein n=1 Tax=Buddleja alternifolia TaxID=168488 RepID=A0AAV6X3E6_9LAMI|nr:hypothetical protein BUALT_Bualt11G0055800 [Buddleja alternifolia]
MKLGDDNYSLVSEEILQLKMQMQEMMNGFKELTVAHRAATDAATDEERGTLNGPFNPLDEQIRSEPINEIQAPSLPTLYGADPLGWLAQVDQHFDLYPCVDEQKVQLAMMAMEGITLNWFRWYKRKRPTFTWQELAHALISRFDDHCDGNMCEHLAGTRQTADVATYINAFTQLAIQLPSLSDDNFLGLLMHVLCEEIRVQVHVLDPVDLDLVMKMSRNIETAIRVQQGGTGMTRPNW